MTACATFKFSKVKTFYDYGDLENKVKVKLVTGSERSYHYAP